MVVYRGPKQDLAVLEEVFELVIAPFNRIKARFLGESTAILRDPQRTAALQAELRAWLKYVFYLKALQTPFDVLAPLFL